MNTKDIVMAAVGAAGAAIALGTLVSTYLEYLRKGRQARAEMFFELRRRLKADPHGHIAQLIDLERSPDVDAAVSARRELEKMSLRDKRDYIGLFEEVALVMRWRLLEREPAHYMFGYYAILCWESPAFWNGVNKWNSYWQWFHEFYGQMKEQQQLIDGDTTIDGVVLAVPDHNGRAGVERLITMKIPPVLRHTFAGARMVVISGATIGEGLQRICDEYPAARDQIFHLGGELNRYINVYVNGEDVRVLRGLDTSIEDGDSINILPASSGGG